MKFITFDKVHIIMINHSRDVIFTESNGRVLLFDYMIFLSISAFLVLSNDPCFL